jgi:hypothetical protein
MNHRKTSLAICAIAVLFLTPYKTQISPDWKIRVVDHQGVPQPNMSVELIWQHFTIEHDAHHEERTTDGEGVVTFQEKVIWSNLASRLNGAIQNLGSTGIHASFGPSASLSALNHASCVGGWIPYRQGKATPDTLVVSNYKSQSCSSLHPGIK